MASKKPLPKVGDRFGKLVIKENLTPDAKFMKDVEYMARCDCGEPKRISYENLLRVKSCGCEAIKRRGNLKLNFRRGAIR